MIRFTLKCSHEHNFESWFRSSDEFAKQQTQGLVECPFCGDKNIQKSLMSPQVTPSRNKALASAPSAPASTPPAQAESQAHTPETSQDIDHKIAEIRAEVEKNSEYVGDNFTDEARKMHQGDSEKRAIYGEAKLDEAKTLIEEGIPVVPLPFKPKKKMN